MRDSKSIVGRARTQLLKGGGILISDGLELCDHIEAQDEKIVKLKDIRALQAGSDGYKVSALAWKQKHDALQEQVKEYKQALIDLAISPSPAGMHWKAFATNALERIKAMGDSDG